MTGVPMPYDWYDSEGFVAAGPTIAGWRALRSVLVAAGPEASRLVRDGAAEDLGELRRELAGVAVPADPTVASSLDALKAALAEVDDVLVLTDGVGVEETDDV